MSADSSRPPARRTQWLLLSPLLVWLLLLVVAPTLILAVYSFASHDELGRAELPVTLENYRRAFGGIYQRILLRSLGLAALTTLLCALIGFPLAYTIARSRPGLRNALLLLVMIPFFTSFLIRTYAWITILSRDGLLNASLCALRVVPNVLAPLDLMYTPTAVLMGLVYSFLPFMVLPIFGSIEKIDNALIEASLDLGAGPWRTLRRVVLPLSAPGIAAGATLVFIPAVGMFAVTDLLGGAKQLLVGNVIQNQFRQASNWPFGAALGMMLLVMFAAASLVVSYLSKRVNGGA